jgi:hypothetical protein
MYEVAPDGDYYKYLETESQKLPPEFDIFPRTREYATDPLENGIDLENLFSRLKVTKNLEYGEKFGWAFRSQKRPSTDEGLIIKTDKPAHQEARLAEGYGYYFKGPILVADRCMSFCIWETAEDGHRSAQGPAHQAAMRMAPLFYESAVLEHFVIDYSPQGVTYHELMPPKVMLFE